MAEGKDQTERETIPNTSSTAKQVIDIERLAEKVYRLMCEEARMNRARGGVSRPRS